jgi:hypothetical protein
MALYRIQPGVNSDTMLWTIHDIRDNSRFTLQPIQYHTSLPNKDNVLLKDNINKILLIFYNKHVDFYLFTSSQSIKHHNRYHLLAQQHQAFH